mmetsp:Transcript_135306/g.191412  ORF Transcript_135306/g.191412 Transcript_135306/m.191412 type:complete len:352 (-) Transcript_135306:258-1313(-)
MANPPTKRVYPLHKRGKKKTPPTHLKGNSAVIGNIQIKKGRWSPDEDEKLLSLVKLQQRKNVNNEIIWDEVEEAFKSRSKKQCRERWLSQLDPTLNKKEWTSNEDQVLLQLSRDLNKRWADIARKIPGRTENMVKNRWHALQRQNKGVSPKRKRNRNNAPRKQQRRQVTPSVTRKPITTRHEEQAQVVYPLSVVNKNSTPRKDHVLRKVHKQQAAAEPLARIPSFETRRNHLMLDRQNSLELRGHPFGDKPDVLERNPSFDVLNGENSLDNLLGYPQLQTSDSLALLEKQLSMTENIKANPFQFGNAGPDLVKQHSLDLGKIGRRQTSYGVSSLAEETIQQMFLDEEPVDW